MGCFAHRGSTVGGLEESRKTGKGAPSSKVEEKKKTQQSLHSAVLDLPSEQQLVIKLTSQQALALALASHRCGALRRKLIFQGIAGQKARVAQTHPCSLGGEQWREAACPSASPPVVRAAF